MPVATTTLSAYCVSESATMPPCLDSDFLPVGIGKLARWTSGKFLVTESPLLLSALGQFSWRRLYYYCLDYRLSNFPRLPSKRGTSGWKQAGH